MKILVYALHPITYQTPIFRDLASRPDCELLVLFGSDISLRPVYYEHLNSYVQFDENLNLDKYPNTFLSNWSRKPNKGFFSRINPSIIREIIKFKPDYVLIHGYETLSSWLCYFACRLLRKKMIFRGEVVNEGVSYHQGTIKRVKNTIMPWYLSAYTKVIYSCQANRDFFVSNHMREQDLISMPCSVDNTFIREWRSLNESRVQQLAKKLSAENYDLIIIFPARFTHRKRPIDLIDAVAKSGKSILILFCGDGELRQEMETKVRELNLNAIFTGFIKQDELFAYYSIADTIAIISEKDPSPKALNEALNFGLIPIVTDVVGTSKDLVKRNGKIVEVGETRVISDYLADLCEGNIDMSSLKQESLKVIEDYSIEASCENLMNNL